MQYDSTLGIFDEEKIYSNAIFSLDEKILNEKILLFFGSKIIVLLQTEHMI